MSTFKTCLLLAALAAATPTFAGNKPATAGGPPATAPGQTLKSNGGAVPGSQGASQIAPGQTFDKSDPGALRGASDASPGKK